MFAVKREFSKEGWIKPGCNPFTRKLRNEKILFFVFILLNDTSFFNSVSVGSRD